MPVLFGLRENIRMSLIVFSDVHFKVHINDTVLFHGVKQEIVDSRIINLIFQEGPNN